MTAPDVGTAADRATPAGMLHHVRERPGPPVLAQVDAHDGRHLNKCGCRTSRVGSVGGNLNKPKYVDRLSDIAAVGDELSPRPPWWVATRSQLRVRGQRLTQMSAVAAVYCSAGGVMGCRSR